jgi:DoxX-like family
MTTPAAPVVSPSSTTHPPVSAWRRRAGLGLSALAILFFLLDASGKLLQVEPVLKGTIELGWPLSAVVPMGLLLLVGAVLYAIPRTAVLGAIYLTGFLGGAIATHYRIGSPLFTHVLFGVYVAAVMWAGLALRFPAVLSALMGPARVR